MTKGKVMFNTNECIGGESAPKRRGHYTKEERRGHVESFKTSQQTVKEYCALHGIVPSTFSRWICQGRKKSGRGFVPVEVNGKSGLGLGSELKEGRFGAQEIAIYCGKLKVILPARSDAKLIIEIMKGVR